MKRLLLTIVMVLTLATSTAVSAFAFTYEGNGKWHETSDGLYSVRLFNGTNYSGDRTTITGSWSKFCDIPMNSNGSHVDMCFFGNDSAHDKVSSIAVITIEAGWDICLYVDENYSGTRLRLTSVYTDVENLGDLSNRFSSARARQEGQSC